VNVLFCNQCCCCGDYSANQLHNILFQLSVCRLQLHAYQYGVYGTLILVLEIHLLGLSAANILMVTTQLMHAIKVHRAAICIIPPLHICAAVQRIRCFKDKSFVRWPPHVNVLYPFHEDTGNCFQDASASAMQALSLFKPV